MLAEKTIKRGRPLGSTNSYRVLVDAGAFIDTRKKLGYNQAEFSVYLQDLTEGAVSLRTVRDIEDGRRIDLIKARAVNEAIGVPVVEEIANNEILEFAMQVLVSAKDTDTFEDQQALIDRAKAVIRSLVIK